MLLFMFAKCFVFGEIHGRNSEKYSRIEVSDHFKIISLNWVRSSRTLMNKLNLSRIRINDMRLNKMMRMIVIFNDFFYDILLIF